MVTSLGTLRHIEWRTARVPTLVPVVVGCGFALCGGTAMVFSLSGVKAIAFAPAAIASATGVLLIVSSFVRLLMVRKSLQFSHAVGAETYPVAVSPLLFAVPPQQPPRIKVAALSEEELPMLSLPMGSLPAAPTLTA